MVKMTTRKVLFAVLAAVSAVDFANAATLECMENYTLVGKDCYLISSDLHTGSSAELFCESNGGHAAIVESKEEMDLLKETLVNTTVYLGINMQEYRKTQIQAALKMAGHTGYTEFGAGEPDNYGSEDCFVADASDGYRWKDIHCTELHFVLCKAPSIVTPSCGEGEYRFENSCFWATQYSDFTWAEAEHMCKNRSMELASIHSEQEQDFIVGSVPHWTSWIGLTDLRTEEVFRWTDGTPFDYQNWYFSDIGNEDFEDCVATGWGTSSTWNVLMCEERLGVLCKGPPS